MYREAKSNKSKVNTKYTEVENEQAMHETKTYECRCSHTERVYLGEGAWGVLDPPPNGDLAIGSSTFLGWNIGPFQLKFLYMPLTNSIDN
jgi:hypothetical protein